MKKYVPELGQYVFGQPSKEFEVPLYVEAALQYIKNELDVIMWNICQEEYSNPFDNTGNSFKNDIFEVQSYSWNDEEIQPYNFKWKDFEISWYKYFGRGMSMNREISPDECSKMFEECVSSIIKMEREILPDFNDEESPLTSEQRKKFGWYTVYKREVEE